MTSTANRRRLVLVVAMLVLVVLAVVVGVVLRDDGDAGDDGAPPSGLADVETYPDLSRDHVEDEVDYPQSPPVGGPHDPAWLNCGAYDQPVRVENAVHSLEHGAVWVTYRSGLTQDELDALFGKLPEKGLLSPYPEQDAPLVVTVWGAQLELDGPDDPRLDLFLDEYGDGHTSPEPLVSCQGGVEEFEDSAANA